MGPSENRARRDLTLVGVVTGAFALVSVKLDLSETLITWAHSRERLQLDELPQILLVLAGLLAWFAWRRVRELRAELGRRRAAETRLAAALAENRLLSRKALDVQERERRVLAREMHDELGQYLVAIRLAATALRDDPGRGEVEQTAAAIVQHVGHVQSVVREMIGRLRPTGLDELGLTAALEACVEGWRMRLPGVGVELATQGNFGGLEEEVSLALYRLTQECLTNASRHAGATRVEVALREEPQAAGDRRVTFSAADDGRGAHPLALAGGRGFGLAGMRERVESLGGELLIDTRPGAGFRVTAIIRTGTGGTVSASAAGARAAGAGADAA